MLTNRGGAAAAPPKGARCFDTDTPGEELGDKQCCGVSNDGSSFSGKQAG